MSNHLKNQTSPYLLQHAENPVDWYPWCEEAFEKAKAEDKPIFLSIGYSTCHWCHVMAHESFENKQIADILNSSFISVKVDKEERPDIDSIYMSVCQALTGNGGWPTSIFITPDKKPFFAGTYFPATARYDTMGFKELLLKINEKWKNERNILLNSADEITNVLNRTFTEQAQADSGIIESAVELYKNSFDKKYGGFGAAPKFPAAHNLIFLLTHYEKSGDRQCLNMAEKSLYQMYRGGLFDHIGGGFCRYSTDKYFLVPHFEKMLYDNALMILAFCKAFSITKNQLYMDIAFKTANYIIREMTSADNAFYSAQDADSDGEEGKYYVFDQSEILFMLGEQDGKAFNRYFDITKQGNFEGKNIPNLLRSDKLTNDFDIYLQKLYEYRLNRDKLHTDDKILTSWNSLMIAAMCSLYRISHNSEYLNSAINAQLFIEKNLCENELLFVSFRDGKNGVNGFFDDYSYYIFALLSLYDATLNADFFKRAEQFFNKALSDFYDNDNGGFYLYGKENETLIARPKETYDGAMPSGNSVMAYNLTRLFYLTSDEKYHKLLKNQLDFLSTEAKQYPAGYAMFMNALSDYFNMPEKIIAVANNRSDLKNLPFDAPLNSIVIVHENPSEEYPLKNDKTTYYICKNHSCMPPVNNLNDI